jgi:hypothetical protein
LDEPAGAVQVGIERVEVSDHAVVGEEPVLLLEGIRVADLEPARGRETARWRYAILVGCRCSATPSMKRSTPWL